MGWKELKEAHVIFFKYTLRKKCPYSEFFWYVFFHIRAENGEILRISPYSVRMWKNADQKNSENEHFSRSDEEGAAFNISRKVEQSYKQKSLDIVTHSRYLGKKLEVTHAFYLLKIY